MICHYYLNQTLKLGLLKFHSIIAAFHETARVQRPLEDCQFPLLVPANTLDVVSRFRERNNQCENLSAMAREIDKIL